MSTTSPRQRAGLVIAGLLSLVSLPSVLVPTPEGEVGPPYAILVLSTVLGVIGLVAVVLAWRGNRAALRVAAGAIIVNLLTTLPALFVDVPLFVKVLSAASILIAVVALILMFSPARRPVPVMD
ncbi:MAG: hypothetical protein ACR2JD_03375 [Nocardioides sp.]